MDTLKVKAVLSNLKKGGKACYQLYPAESKVMSQEEFVKLLATKLGKGEAEARYINDQHGVALCEAILANRNVNTGTIRAFLVATGSVESAAIARLNRRATSTA